MVNKLCDMGKCYGHSTSIDCLSHILVAIVIEIVPQLLRSALHGIPNFVVCC
jgi:hypothetical protein